MHEEDLMSDEQISQEGSQSDSQHPGETGSNAFDLTEPGRQDGLSRESPNGEASATQNSPQPDFQSMATVKKDEALPKDAWYAEDRSVIVPIVGTAIVYALVIFFCALVGPTGGGFPPIILLLSVAAATVFICTVWAAMGPKRFLHRWFISHLVGMIPATGAILAGILLTINRSGGLDRFEDFWMPVVIMLLGILPVTLGAQIPLWLLRAIFGWQIVRIDVPNEEKFNLRDIFAVTFVIALCFAVPQISANLMYGELNEPVSQFRSEQVVASDGSVTYETVKLTEEELVVERERYRRELPMAMYGGYGISLGIALIISTLSIPFLFLAMIPKDTASGCGFAAFYAFGIAIAILMLFTGFFGSVGNNPEPFLVIFGLGASYGAAIVIPLAIIREFGYRLSQTGSVELNQG